MTVVTPPCRCHHHKRRLELAQACERGEFGRQSASNRSLWGRLLRSMTIEAIPAPNLAHCWHCRCSLPVSWYPQRLELKRRRSFRDQKEVVQETLQTWSGQWLMPLKAELRPRHAR